MPGASPGSANIQRERNRATKGRADRASAPQKLSDMGLSGCFPAEFNEESASSAKDASVLPRASRRSAQSQPQS